MAMLETEVRDGVDRETVETVQAMAGKYKYGWETEIEGQLKGVVTRGDRCDRGGRDWD